jgi:hypothetical protein
VLADLECNIGNLKAAFALQERGRRHAEAFGHAGYVRWLAGECVGEHYWRGDWDEALRGADSLIAEVEAGVPNFMEAYCRAMRARIRLARGDRGRALDDAARAVEFAQDAQDAQVLYPALAFRARAEVVAGSLDLGAILSDELLARWRAKPDAFPASSWAVDLGCALDGLDRGAELVAMTDRIGTKTRWFHAVVAFLAGDHRAAAEQFAEIGSRPDEAFARLRAAGALLRAQREDEAGRELRLAIAFYRATSATAYLEQATSLAGGSFVREAT